LPQEILKDWYLCESLTVETMYSKYKNSRVLKKKLIFPKTASNKDKSQTIKTDVITINKYLDQKSLL
jgi:hypothetical protein